MNTTSFAETACNTHFSPFSRLRRRLTKSINTNQSEYSTLYLKSEKNRNNWETLTTRTDPREPWQQHKLYSDHRTLIQDLCKLYTDIFYLIWRVTSEKVTIDGYFPSYPFWNGNGKGITFFRKDTGKISDNGDFLKFVLMISHGKHCFRNLSWFILLLSLGVSLRYSYTTR